MTHAESQDISPAPHCSDGPLVRKNTDSENEEEEDGEEREGVRGGGGGDRKRGRGERRYMDSIEDERMMTQAAKVSTVYIQFVCTDEVDLLVLWSMNQLVLVLHSK